MKKHLYTLSLIGIILFSCHKQDSVKPDMASKVIGHYSLSSSYFLLTNTHNLYQSGSLTVTRLGIDSVQGEVNFEGVRSQLASGNWQLKSMSMTGDTIRMSGGGCGCWYAGKQVNMRLADATLQFTFKKDD